jgi:hypothetical protein
MRAVARRLADAPSNGSACYSGSVGLDSSLDRGTIFVIDIPLDGRTHLNAPTLPRD